MGMKREARLSALHGFDAAAARRRARDNVLPITATKCALGKSDWVAIKTN